MPSKNKNFRKVLTLTGWTIYAYVFMEWLFFATIPSFMSAMNLLQRLGLLFLATFMLLLPLLLLTTILAAFSPRLAAAIPALVLSALGLILLDNFTYTLFKVGIVSSSGVGRLGYAAGFVALFVFLLLKCMAWLRGEAGRGLLRSGPALLILVGVSAAVFLIQIREFRIPHAASTSAEGSGLPNIILIGIDGVNATHMSVYGYERDTTPNITRLASQALVAEDAFSNAGKTGGSLTSMLTGKPPTETRVFFPPDILLGEDAYQHLPGILKQHGYRTVQITMQYYGDAYERNVQDGFDVVNGRTAAQSPLVTEVAGLEGGGSGYLVGQLLARISQRLEHIFFIRKMTNPYAAVTNPSYALHDDERMSETFQYLDEAKGPLFLHVHLMDSHGPEFYDPHPYYAKPEEENKDWNIDYFDDTIRDSDQYVKDLFDHVEKTGKRDNTLVILYSDHDMKWDTLQRVPLIFWFPRQEYKGLVESNVQLLDVAPTILDYLHIAQPSWMSGQSVISKSLQPTRPIFSSLVSDNLLRVTDDRKTWVIDETKIRPPFYQLGKLNLVVCSRWYSLDLASAVLTSGSVAGSTDQCSRGNVPDERQASQMILDYLKADTYDVASLKASLLAREIQP